MEPVSETRASITFGRFRVLPHRRELLADGRPIKLGGRAFDVLMALIEERGGVIDKDTLMRRVWPDRGRGGGWAGRPLRWFGQAGGHMYVDSCFGGLSIRSATLIGATIIVGLIHHTDHVLRVDHSGWPFRPDVNPFTFSLLAYPILLFALLGPARLFWLRWCAFLVGTGFTLWAHTMIETPAMQYAMWAHNHSLEPQQPDTHNILGLQSAVLGVVAVIVALVLDLLLVIAVLSMLRDGLLRRARGSKG